MFTNEKLMQNNSYAYKNILQILGGIRASRMKSLNNVFIKLKIKRSPTL